MRCLVCSLARAGAKKEWHINLMMGLGMQRVLRRRLGEMHDTTHGLVMCRLVGENVCCMSTCVFVSVLQQWKGSRTESVLLAGLKPDTNKAVALRIYTEICVYI